MTTDDTTEPATASAPDDDAALLAAIGAAITAARTTARFSQRALAAESGINRSYLHSVEKGTGNPSTVMMVRIARTLGITVAELLADIT